MTSHGHTRPAPRPESRVGRGWHAVHAASWLLVLVGACVVVTQYGNLPEQVPTHADLTGTVDGFGPRTSVWALLATWVLLQASLSLLAAVPHRHNYPLEVTEQNAQQLYRRSTSMLLGVALGMALAFLGMVLLVVGSGLGGLLVTVGLVGVLAALVVGVARLLSAA